MKKLNEETQKTIKSRKRWILILCIVLPLIAVFKFATIGFAEPVPEGLKKQNVLYQASGATTEGTSDSGNVSPSGIPGDQERVDDVVNKPANTANVLITGINSMWSTVGDVIRGFAADNNIIGFNSAEMGNFAEKLSYIFKWLNPKFCVNTVQQCKNRNYKYILKQAAAAFGVAALVTS